MFELAQICILFLFFFICYQLFNKRLKKKGNEILTSLSPNIIYIQNFQCRIESPGASLFGQNATSCKLILTNYDVFIIFSKVGSFTNSLARPIYFSVRKYPALKSKDLKRVIPQELTKERILVKRENTTSLFLEYEEISFVKSPVQVFVIGVPDEIILQCQNIFKRAV